MLQKFTSFEAHVTSSVTLRVSSSRSPSLSRVVSPQSSTCEWTLCQSWVWPLWRLCLWSSSPVPRPWAHENCTSDRPCAFSPGRCALHVCHRLQSPTTGDCWGDLTPCCSPDYCSWTGTYWTCYCSPCCCMSVACLLHSATCASPPPGWHLSWDVSAGWSSLRRRCPAISLIRPRWSLSVCPSGGAVSSVARFSRWYGSGVGWWWLSCRQRWRHRSLLHL